MEDGLLHFFDSQNRKTSIRIQRVQMEQDTAKTIVKEGQTLIDYNRAGMPLLEIVTDAQFTTPEDCKLLVREV